MPPPEELLLLELLDDELEPELEPELELELAPELDDEPDELEELDDELLPGGDGFSPVEPQAAINAVMARTDAAPVARRMEF